MTPSIPAKETIVLLLKSYMLSMYPTNASYC